jgi:AAA+ superfamily predicted ATPase
VIDKLVLPEDRKTLVGMLVAGSSQLMEDIVKGKTGGVVVICVGPPGTGKTLTAQVFSEQIKRPLYEVQCSQLGTDEEALEKELRKVLQRATRWNAILLIDEADVYIHERGNDIHQNAIVGVFLRVLEAYRGVLFMTSNRATIIDDAILSRATAYIEYTYPTKEALRRIWRVLSDHYLLEFDEDQIDTLTSMFEGISGRRVKALIKLARLAARQKNQPVTVELVNYVNQFLPKDSDCAKSSTRSQPVAAALA